MEMELDYQAILKKAKSLGVDFCDIYLEKNQQNILSIEDQKVDHVSCGIHSGGSIRLIHDFKTIFGSTNDTSTANMLNITEYLGQSLNIQKRDQNFNLSNKKMAQPFDITMPPGNISINDKVKRFFELDQSIRKMDDKIAQVEISYSDSHKTVVVANTEGLWIEFPRTQLLLSISITLFDGSDYHTGDDTIGGHTGYEILTAENIHKCIQKALHQANLSMTSDRSLSGTMPVIISSQAGGTFVHEAIGHGLEGDLIAAKTSIYKNKLGKKIASEKITIVDDPTIPGKRGSYLYDDEGTKSQTTTLIENGVLKNYLLDHLSAQKLGLKKNAHARRESYEHKPIPRMSNTIMLPGHDDPEDILKSVQDGLFVKVMGGGQVNTHNGDFVFEVVEGYKIENGQLGEPIVGATISGNGPKVLKQIEKIGNDLGFSLGTCGKEGQDVPITDAMPTVLIPKIIVGGIGALDEFEGDDFALE